MKRRTLVGLLLCLGLCLALVPSSFADESPPDTEAAGDVSAAAVASARWLINDVETSDDVGQHVSVALSGDTTWISYYDATNGNLRVARSGVSGGNCGPGNTWACQSVDTGGDVGRYSSIAINPTTGYPAIAYYDVTNTALKYTAYGCSPIILIGCSWSLPVIIDNTNDTGHWASLKIDAAGKPHIAYYDYRAGTGCTGFPPTCDFGAGSLKYTQRPGSGGNCGPANTWQCDIIDSSVITGVGQYASLDLSAIGQPYIAYYAAGDLKYAWFGGSPANCGPATSWRCIIVDDGGSDDVGRYASLHVAKGSSEVTQIAYYDATNRSLKYATFATSGACTPSGWNCRGIDSIGEIPTTVTRAISVVGGADGDTLIAYYDADDGSGDLKLAYPQFFTGNCAAIPGGGFPPTVFYTWRCETLDAGPPFVFGTTHSVGQYAALARNSAGLVTVAYYNATAGDLRIAYQRAFVFMPTITR